MPKIEDFRFIECNKKVPFNRDKCIVYIQEERKVYLDYYFNFGEKDGEIYQGFVHSNDGSEINVCKGIYWMLDPSVLN